MSSGKPDQDIPKFQSSDASAPQDAPPEKRPHIHGDPERTAPVQADGLQSDGPHPDPAPDDETVDAWPLQAERMALRSPLIECLRILAGQYGRRASRVSLTAGLPVSKAGITPDLFARAASRVDMHSRLTERGLDAILTAPTLPCILVLDKGHACILWDIKKVKVERPDGKKGARIETRLLVQFPETEDERTLVKIDDLQPIYSGYAFYVRPIARTDDRAGPAAIDNLRDWFWSALKDNKRIYQEVVAASVMINFFAVVSSLFIMNVYDRVIPNNAFETLWALAIGVAVVYVFDFMLKNLRAHFLDVAGRKADVKISARLFEQLLGMTMTARPASAGVLASNMKEFEGLRDFFTSATITAFVDLPFSLLFILLIAMIAGPLALVPLAALPIVVFGGIILRRPLQKIIKASMMESALKNALLFETISGLETIKSQAAEGHIQNKWEELTDRSSRTSVKSKRVSSFSINFAVFVQQMTTVAIVIVGVYMISEAMISMGALVATVLLSGRALGPLAQVAGLQMRFQQSREALAQLDDLMKRPVERPSGKHFIAKPTVDGHVEFRDVTFHYPDQSVAALQDLNWTIQPGERIGIIGAVGSGKTTLERLILNLYQPTSGAVLIDGTDVRQIDPGDLRRAVGVVQQSPQLFYGTVRENITMGNELVPARAVVRAAQLAGVMEFLSETQHGLDTQVGERGEALSGGQRQAVGIARALLYDPKILILDEPTSSMDPASEARLLKRLHVLCEGKTTLLITHKGPMLSLVDRLMLIDRGRIVALGPRDEIIRRLQNRQYGTQAENTDI